MNTGNDARMPVEELYRLFGTLEKHGWISETVAISARQRDGQTVSLPIPSLRTKQAGRAAWIISGIHGEEPAGPNAIAEGIEVIRALGEDIPVVLLPLCNPLGYFSSWRYLDQPEWREGTAAASVGDSEHVLPDIKNPAFPRIPAASSPEAAALAAHVLRLSKTYPPAMTFDLHEDNLLDRGYIYSQGRSGVEDEAASQVVDALRSSEVPIQMTGTTRFGETIAQGIVGPQNDGSIDELLAAGNIILDGKTAPGPAAETVIVIETPAAALPFDIRVRAHLAVLGRLPQIAAGIRQ